VPRRPCGIWWYAGARGAAEGVGDLGFQILVLGFGKAGARLDEDVPAPVG
jgi:hypothetical protein